jgi:hypothetical protein
MPEPTNPIPILPPSPPSKRKRPDPEILTAWGKRFVMALRRSITEIQPIDWPDRIIAALQTASSRDHFSAMASVAARKLQIPKFHTESAEELFALETEIRAAAAFDDFRRHIEREAEFVEAMARTEAKAIREAYAIEKAADQAALAAHQNRTATAAKD